jgi:hypothetical protein
MRARILVIVALLLPIGAGHAQKNCRKGIPCGNSCIAANKVCRIGTPRPVVQSVAVDSGVSARTDTAQQTAAWVGSSRGSTYYRSGCAGARKLSPRNLIYFKTEEDAQHAGYRHSVQRGC